MKLIDIDAKTFPTPYKINNTEHANGWNSCLNSISQQPIIDAELVRHGHWESSGGFDKCSMCGSLELGRSRYCPWCGARMDGK